MIKIKEIEIHKFRGIIDLKINFENENYVICGPNGTGKSGIVDAIEFALSGDISRLSGEGRGKVSVKAHGPHVDFRDSSEEASVSIKGTIVATKERFSISRNVKNSTAPYITPTSPSVASALNKIESRKNISLSRRELIKCIISTNSKRSEQIIDLLQLDVLRDIRSTLKKILNSEEKALKNAEAELQTIKDNLGRSLNIRSFCENEVLEAVNAKRSILGLPNLISYDINKISFIDEMTTSAPDAPKQIDSKTALNDISDFESTLATLQSEVENKQLMSLQNAVDAIAKDRLAWKSVQRQKLLNDALNQLDDDACPVCEKEWEIPALTERLRSRLASLDEIDLQKRAAISQISPCLQNIRKLNGILTSIDKYQRQLVGEDKVYNLNVSINGFEESLRAIDEFESQDEIKNAVTIIQNNLDKMTPCLNSFQKGLGRLSKSSNPVMATQFLTTAQERLMNFQKCVRNIKIQKNNSERAKQILDIFEKNYEKNLNRIYKNVQSEFSRYYQLINSDDEGDFSAVLAAQGASLDLNVDFYGKGKFPPSAYHSEGHQDGMGLCLYLALMKHLYASDFNVCILDDVLTSVDSGHRRAVCELIRKEFTNTQFIFTTHDKIWLKNMQTTGLVSAKNYLLFRKWSVDTGPQIWEGRDVWEEINNFTINDDIAKASHLLRYYLEYLFSEVCDMLEAQVIYRGDNRHSLGDLLPQGYSRLKKLLKEAKEAAKSWGNGSKAQEVTNYILSLEACYQASLAEQWAMNSSIHYNKWENMQEQDFRQVVDAFKNLCAKFSCSRCNSLLRLFKANNEKGALQCECAKISFNLKKHK